jgi:DNA repair exonuclease SbcCD ATPase subunit
MKLTLSNFKCYKTKTFEFPDKGLTLIHGKSGSGKSTICQAISFVLYDNVKSPYTFDATTCSVSIELNLQGKVVVVKRQKRPNRLIVKLEDKTYEDEEAENQLNQLFHMSEEEFCVSSYIKQKSLNSLLFLPQQKLLELVEKIAFQDSLSPSVVKDALQKQLKLREAKCEQISTRLSVYNSQLKSKRIDLERDFGLTPPACPVDNIAEWRQGVEETQKNLGLLRGEKDKLEKQLSTYDQIKAVESVIADLSQEITKRKETLKTKREEENLWSQGDVEAVSCMIEYFETVKTILRKTKEIYDLESQMAEYISTRQSEVNEEVEAVEAQISHYTLKLSELQSGSRYDEEMEALQSTYQLSKKIDECLSQPWLQKLNIFTATDSSVLKLKKTYTVIDREKERLDGEVKSGSLRLQNMQRELDKLSELTHVRRCPHCQAHLILTDDGDLQEYTTDSVLDNIQERQKELRKNIESLKVKMREVSNLYLFWTKMPETKEFYHGNFELLKPYLTQKEFSEQLQRLRTQRVEMNDTKLKLDQCKQRLSALRTTHIQNEPAYKRLEMQKQKLSAILKASRSQMDESDYYDSEHLSCEESEFDQQITEWSTYIDDNTEREKTLRFEELEIKKLEQKMERLHTELAATKDGLVDSYDALVAKLVDVKKDLNDLEEQMHRALETSDKINRYEAYTQRLASLEEIELVICEQHQELESNQRLLSATQALKEKCLYAEVLSIEDTVGLINSYSEVYLKFMFETSFDPEIKVALKTFKELKTSKVTKPRINTVIEYKNYTYDSIDQVSGGESDRISLAFVLALNSLFRVPFLMLDECLSSLDSELNTLILERLREYAKDKLLLVVSHEANHGVFDHVVNVDDET